MKLSDSLSPDGPWLALAEQRRELAELRKRVDRMLAEPSAATPTALGDVSKRLNQFDDRMQDVIRTLQFLDIRVAKQSILLMDAKALDTLNQGERIAGILLSLCTLFIGALLQNMVSSADAQKVGLLAAIAFAILSVVFYVRSQRRWHDIRQDVRPLALFSEPPDTQSEAEGGGS